MKFDWKRHGKNLLRKMAWLLAVFLLFVVLLELFYRNQWIDTYRRELNALNLDVVPANPKRRILVMGDSFSATTNSWVNLLRTNHPDFEITNSSVPGTGIYQANLMLSRRLSTFKPDLLIYQIYVGNDLFDLRYPTNWKTIGWARNLYWSAANHIRSLAWANYALGQLKRAANAPDYQQGKVNEGEFQAEKYSERERIYLRAEPGLIADEVMLTGKRAADIADYMAELQDFLETAKSANCPVLLLVIPHCAQVDAVYAQRMAELGATGMDEPALQAIDYPFLQRLSTLQGSGMRLLNILPALQAAEQLATATYYLHDAHLNDAGQQLVAKVVEEYW